KGGPHSMKLEICSRKSRTSTVARCDHFQKVERNTFSERFNAMMKLRTFSIAAACFCACVFAAASSRADQSDDEKAIRKLDQEYVDAYNKHDAKALAALWSPEAVYVDPETGDQAVGREEIEKEFAETFSGLKEAKLEVDAKAIKFLSPNVAIEEGVARVIQP